MRVDQKISEFLDGHLPEKVVAEVRPYLGAGSTWFRFGYFRRRNGEIVRGIEVSTMVDGFVVHLVPMTNAQIQEGIDILSAIYASRRPGVWKFSSGMHRYRLTFRKFTGKPSAEREEVKARLVVWTWLSVAVNSASMYRHQIKGFVESLEKLLELPPVILQPM